MINYMPSAGDLLNGSRTTNGTIITIPAGRGWSGEILVSATAALAATVTPTVTVSGVGADPDNGSIVHRLSITGLALTTVADSANIGCIVVAPEGNAVTLEFNTGGATSASVVVNGFLL